MVTFKRNVFRVTSHYLSSFCPRFGNPDCRFSKFNLFIFSLRYFKRIFSAKNLISNRIFSVEHRLFKSFIFGGAESFHSFSFVQTARFWNKRLLLYYCILENMGVFDIIAMSLITTIPILYTFPMIMAHFFKIQGYKISDQTECNQLINKLNIRRSVFYQNGKPFGVFYGKWYIGYIYSGTTILMLPWFFNLLWCFFVWRCLI